MNTQAPRPRVLVIGLDPHRVPGPWDPEPVAQAIEAGMAEFTQHGVLAERCLIGLDGSNDVEAVVTEALGHGPWDCVVVGGGIRTSEEHLDIFEMVINLVHRHAADAPIAFNNRPDGTFEAASRWLA